MRHSFLALVASLIILAGCASAQRFDVDSFDAKKSQSSLSALITAYVAYHGQGLEQEIHSSNHAAILPKLQTVAFKNEIVVFFAPGLQTTDGEELWGIYFKPNEKHGKLIFINADSTADEQVSTLAHELAHAIGPELPHPQDDVFAQAVSFLVCEKFGFETAEVTVAYYDSLIKERDTVLNILAAHAKEIEATAETIFKDAQ